MAVGLAALAYLYAAQLSATAVRARRFIGQFEFRSPVTRARSQTLRSTKPKKTIVNALADQFPEYEDAIAAIQMPNREIWIRDIGDHLVTSQALFTYLKDETPSDVFKRLASEDASSFYQFARGYAQWHKNGEAHKLGKLKQFAKEHEIKPADQHSMGRERFPLLSIGRERPSAEHQGHKVPRCPQFIPT